MPKPEDDYTSLETSDTISLESETKHHCSQESFDCGNNNCINIVLLCDGHDNCGNGADELDCPEVDPDEFDKLTPNQREDFDQQMSNLKESIKNERLCDNGYFDCGNSNCIKSRFRCDDDDDCDNEEDEKDCQEGSSFVLSDDSSCGPKHLECRGERFCIPKKWLCDGHADCVSGNDEVNCTAISECKGFSCPNTRIKKANLGNMTECKGFRCKNGDCIPGYWRCDGDEDCKDDSDEQDCMALADPTPHSLTFHGISSSICVKSALFLVILTLTISFWGRNDYYL